MGRGITFRKGVYISVVLIFLIPALSMGVLSALQSSQAVGMLAAIASQNEQTDTNGGGTSAGNGMDTVAVAREELANAASNIGGFKYKDWYGMNADWCAMFVSWCADQCGYIESRIFPRTASVYQMYDFFRSNGRFHYKEESYEPQPGDVIIYNVSQHTGLVVDYDPETQMITTIEGNTGSSSTSPFHLGSQVNERHYPKSSARITGFGNPDYPEWGNAGAGPLQEGQEINIPAGLGAVHTYMGWQCITSPSSLQYKLRQEAGMNFDSEGFGRIGDRYVVACTTTFGGIGDYIDIYKSDGTIIKGIIGDIKNQTDPGCNQWGHLNGTCIIEFVVDKGTWYNSGHPNPGTANCHPEWSQTISKIVNRGSYWG